MESGKMELIEGISRELVEELAEHVHDMWAKNRRAEGWTYGETRNDEKKETPCLVPYAELPEIEKEYDRCTAMETIRFLTEKGYKITR